ncbi:UDP-N-acetylmuramyl-tripeptide synthetase [bacterium]|nr:UDP-N-acetylmuramyl-tripeptide synthetase [bacterium]
MELKNLIKKFVPSPLLNFYHLSLSFLGAVFYGFPSRKLKVIGVTGTNGKTTTTEMITKILEENGFGVALANSIRFKIKEKEQRNESRMTMPGRAFLQKFLREAVKERCQYAVLEVTSEGIIQYRHKFIDFDTAILTNLSPEHIERHAGFENYKRAKGELFQVTKNIHIINLDDKNADYFLQFRAKEKYLYRKVNGKEPMVKIEIQKEGFSKTLKFPLSLNLLGDFNIYNALAAICLGLSQGIDLAKCKRSLASFRGVEGRMEEVISKPFRAIVDYAFTPNALEKVYQTLVNRFVKQTKGQLICVLGACGGGRDKWKRPVLGKIAAKYCNKVILTNEDPYDEDPMEIINQVAEGTQNQQGKSVYKILDRREAIKKSLELAKKDDVIIITGKGCEPSICLAQGKKIPWDDRRVLREEFEKIYEKI